MTVWDIKSIPLFEGLNPAQVHNLIEIAHKNEYKKGSVICKYGEKTRDVFIIVAGSMEVFSEAGVSLSILNEKQVFGEIGFAYGLERTASVVAREESTLLVINRNLLENLSKTDPTIKHILLNNMVTSLSKKLIQANRNIERLSIENKKLRDLINQSPKHKRR